MRVLFVTPRPPWRGRRGDQMRTAGLVAALSDRHQIHVISQGRDGFGPPAPPAGVGSEVVVSKRVERWFRRVSAYAAWPFGRRPFQVTVYDLSAFEAAVERTLADWQPDVVILVLSRLGSMTNVVGRVPLILDYIDSLGLNMRQRAKRQGYLGPLLRREARLTEEFEAELLQRVDAGLVVAERDREWISSHVSSPDMAPIHVLPVIVDCESSAADSGDLRTKVDIVLTGNLGYFPTVDGALWFASGPWRRMREAMPQCRWLLAGARPDDRLKRLGKESGIEVVAGPEDLKAELRRARVAIAPLHSGSGTPIKILEAMANGIAVVTTSSGAKGLDGVPPDAVAVADDADAFAGAVLALLTDDDRRQQQVAAAQGWLRSRHSRGAVGAQLEGILEGVVARAVSA